MGITPGQPLPCLELDKELTKPATVIMQSILQKMIKWTDKVRLSLMYEFIWQYVQMQS